MIILLIIIGIFVLYWRTLGYCYLIDDIVRRWGYLYEIPEMSPPPTFFSSKPHPWRHLFPIITHALNVWLVHCLFGIYPAILFAFSPLAVPGAAWITGGYYSVTAFLTLTAYFFLINFKSVIGLLIANLFFTAALGSTITCIGFPFIFFIFNYSGLTFFYPVFMYLAGKRFRTGYNIRNLGKQDSFKLRKIPVMIKVVAYYLHMCVFPYRLCFFKGFGDNYVNDKNVRKNLESYNGWFYLSLLSIIIFILIGWQFSPLGVVWFLATIAPFTQYKVLGQFVAERYIYLPLIGWCLILGSALSPYPILFWVVVTLYIYRTHRYIPAYEKIESLYEDGIKNDPTCLANYANLGERYIHTGRLWEGYKILKRGLEIDPDNFLCWTNSAAFWIQVKDIEKGIYYTEKSISLGEKSSWFIVNAMNQQLRSLLEYRTRWHKEITWAGNG